MSTNDDAEALAARKLELEAEHKQMPLFDAEVHMAYVKDHLLPLPKDHWSRKKDHQDFMRAGWRRLNAKKDQEISDLRGRILNCMGKCSGNQGVVKSSQGVLAGTTGAFEKREALIREMRSLYPIMGGVEPTGPGSAIGTLFEVIAESIVSVYG